MAKWEESVTRCGGVMMSAKGEVIPGRGMGGYNVSWADMNLIRQKNEENTRSRFRWYKWTMNDELFYLKKYMQLRSSFVYLIA
jgi:hypothetical protein